ncbi:MAG TPA: FKBP-type peptidyl-prolyl cis-trans isomerase [Candidatus Mediterraneibacter avicola]|nr:FKBP-type peptidyl-prolyl cis-trans isomerase [Candidatus Mediterraneibacter avicola]
MAQQRRAQERRKKAVRRKISTILAVVIPILALAALVAVLIIFTAPESSGSSDSSGTAETDNTSDTGTSDTAENTDTPVLSTDSSLTIENGDTVNIDYVGTVDGVEFDGGSTNGAGADLTIGSGRYIDDFEEQLIGSHPGDTVEVNVTFPEDYGNEELNGKDAVFEVVINGIYE